MRRPSNRRRAAQGGGEGLGVRWAAGGWGCAGQQVRGAAPFLSYLLFPHCPFAASLYTCLSPRLPRRRLRTAQKRWGDGRWLSLFSRWIGVVFEAGIVGTEKKSAMSVLFRLCLRRRGSRSWNGVVVAAGTHHLSVDVELQPLNSKCIHNGLIMDTYRID